MSKLKLVLLLALITVIAIAVIYAPEYLNLKFLKSILNDTIAYKNNHLIQAIILFSLIYIVCTALSVPGALILTLASGGIFGFYIGSLVSLISATIGATLSFWVARYFLGDFVQQRMGDKLSSIRENFAKEGALYLFSMRLAPIFPFFAVNLLMALTPIKSSVYFFVSLIGMAAGTMVFVNAGTQIAKITTLKGILSPSLLVSFLLLAVFPYIAKYLINLLRKKT